MRIAPRLNLPGRPGAKLRLDVVQVAVTSRCNASCVYCPHTMYRKQWINQDLDPALFEAMLPALSGVKRIHLQGWGEPFLHPNLVDFISQAKRAGLHVSTTTNGARLDPKLLEAAVAAGLDDLGLSLAGVTAEENDAIRVGAPFEAVTETIARVHSLASKRPVPTLHIAYMALASHRQSVHRLPALMAKLGVSEGVVSALGFAPDRHLEEEGMLARNDEEKRTLRSFRRSMFQLSLAAAFQGINLYYQLPRPKRRKSCPENVDSSLVVGADGQVAPCVMGRLPVKGNCYHWYAGEERLYAPMVFATLDADPAGQLAEAASGQARREFLRTFRNRPPQSCLQCVKRHMAPE
ncbi:radical SAM/SPASM domain-containing protein [Oceanidesulfovibrio marinus]|nr:radical SAM/SPASM domain-containing protein [Oceanidesulfovibrio marinus]